MSDKKWYEKLYLRMFTWAMVLVLFLALQLVREQKKERELIRLKAVLPDGVITEEILSQTEMLPGFRKRWALIEKDCSIQIGEYYTQARITGIDLDSWPMTVKVSAGKKAEGTIPLLVVGDAFFSGLSDDNGGRITQHQAEILEKKIGELEVRLQTDAKQRGDTGESSLKSSSQQGSAAGEPAWFLAVAEGSGVYMEITQMQRWLEKRGEQVRISGVILELQGADNAAKAQESMEKAGFTVEMMENPA